MSKASSFLCGAVATALLVPAPSFALPATGQAKVVRVDTANQWGGGYRRRHRDNIDAGDILTGILIIGGIAAVAGAIDSATKPDRRNRDDRYPDNRYPDTRYPDSSNYPETSYPDDNYSQGSEDQAVNDCAQAAESRAANSNGVGQVRDVDNVQTISGGYRVTGTVETRANYRTGSTRSSGFSCDWRNGQVENVNVNY